MSMVIWRLKEFMDAHHLTPRQVEKAARIGENTIYRVLRGNGAMLVDRRTLSAIIAGLRELTGKEVNVQDLLVYDDSAKYMVFRRTYSDVERVKVEVEEN